MKAWAWSIPGLLFPLMLPGLPRVVPLFVLLFALVFLLRRWSPRVVFILLGFGWTGIHVQERLQERIYDPSSEPVIVSGRVNSLPLVRGDMLEFRFLADKSKQQGEIAGKELVVRWYRDYPEVLAGESWQLSLRIKAARGRVNFQGPDRERWYFSQGIAALGVVKGKQNRNISPPVIRNIPHQRQRTRDAITRVVDNHPSRSLLLALALADRSEIQSQAWQRFRLTGTSHLLAISGMHIGLAAVIGYWLGRAALFLLPSIFLIRFGQQLAMFSSISVASLYAVMAGLGTSTQRALVMLLIFIGLKIIRRSTRPWTAWLLALFLVLVVNPFAPLETGFWFSFIAVAILLVTFAPRTGPRHWLATLVLAQVSVTAVMLPLGMLFFQQATMLGLVSNLAAIPWVSFITVPAILLGVLTLPLGDPLAPFLLLIAAQSLQILDGLLSLVESLGVGAWMSTIKPGLLPVVLASFGVLLVLVPGRHRLRHLGLLLAIPVMIPVMIPGHRHRGGLETEMLDVGQGLAVVVRTADQQMLYDTGPGKPGSPGNDSSWDLVSTVLTPALNGRAPDLVIVSHGDLDHAGGMSKLVTHYPETVVMASLRELPNRISSCDNRYSWSWDDTGFEILHPSHGLPYLGNDSSCVVSISYGTAKILLTGDISSNIENRLAIDEVDKHQVLFAPHHGSKSSSEIGFLKMISPEIALVSTAYQNSFNFPHPDVKGRYGSLDIPLLNTADCGAIRATARSWGDIQLESARKVKSAIWRWPADANCP